jgi:hypothetical protein
MQTTYFPTHRLRFSRPAPPLPGWPETEDWDPGHAFRRGWSIRDGASSG